MSRRALPRRGRDASAALGGSASVVRALRSSWPGQAGAGAQVDADRPGCHGREAIAVWDIGLPGGARAGQKVAPPPGLPLPSHACTAPLPQASFTFAPFGPTRSSPAATASSEFRHAIRASARVDVVSLSRMFANVGKRVRLYIGKSSRGEVPVFWPVLLKANRRRSRRYRRYRRRFGPFR